MINGKFVVLHSTSTFRNYMLCLIFNSAHFYCMLGQFEKKNSQININHIWNIK